MKIGFDAKRYFKNATGLGNYSRWLVDGLKSRVSDTRLYYPSRMINLPKGAEGPSSFIGQRFPSLWRSLWMTRDLKKDGIEIYHGLSNELPRGIHKTGIKTVVTIHDLIQKRYPENYGPIDSNIYNWKVKYAQRVADCIVVPSRQTKKDLIRFFKTDEKKIKVIPLGTAPLPEFKSESPIEGDYVLCVSGLSQRKNILRLIKAFRSPKLKNVQLVISGRAGDTSKRVMQLSASMANIKIILNPTTAAIHQLYANATFCVYPSLFEGFGIPVLEAFQHGKTMAVSKISSLPEVGGEAVLYFDPRNVDEMSECISQLYFSEKQREYLEGKIPAQIAQFNPELLLNQYTDIYTALIQSQ